LRGGLRSNSQHGNLAVLEGEVVSELSRTAWKVAADLRCGDGLNSRLGQVGYGSNGLVFGYRAINPFLDASALILV